MNIWLRLINLDTWKSSTIEIDGDRTLLHGARLERSGEQWLVREPRLGAPVFVNNRDVHTHQLTHGDAFTIGNTMHVFLTRPSVENDPALVAHLDERPDDEHALKVWADWLLEHGDPLGEHLLSPEPQPWVLEGVDTTPLELTWNHGLIIQAKLRCTPDSANPVETLARLTATRVMRWVRDLTIDCSSWNGSMFETQRSTSAALRVLLEGAELPSLRRLAFGVHAEAFESPGLFTHLESRIAKRFPNLETNVSLFFLARPYSTLGVVYVPPELDFHAPHARDGKLPLTNGAWVGSSEPGQLRLLTQGVHRGGVQERFLIERTADRISLFPVDGVTLNARPAMQTRLLDGDLIETSDGARFVFNA